MKYSPKFAYHINILDPNSTFLKLFLTSFVFSSTDNLLKAVLKFHTPGQITKVDPEFVRKTLRKNLALLENQTRENKLLLLEHAMSDNAYQKLQGIHLLPLGNGTFGVFESTAAQQPVFLDSVEHSRLLLPGLTDWFVDENIPIQLQRHLTKAAQQNCKLLFNLIPFFKVKKEYFVFRS